MPKGQRTREEVEIMARDVQKIIAAAVPPDLGHLFLLFDLDSSSMAYMSNVNGKYLIHGLRTLLNRLEMDAANDDA